MIIRFSAFACLFIGLGLPAFADKPASPRVTRTVEIVRAVEDGVVAVFSKGEDGVTHSGSGSIIHAGGFVLTNDHVVRDRPGWVLVNGRKPARYETVGRLPEKDLAIVRIPGPEELTVIALGHSDDLMTGEPCLCAGNPGGRGVVFTAGMVSAPAIMKDAPSALVMANYTSDARDRFIQFDAASNPGNSGGPLINAESQQIGVVSAGILKEENINYAIPIDRVREHVVELIAPEISRDLFAGLAIDPLAREARVTSVAPDSPAAASGLREGDVLLTANGADLRDGLDWLFQLATHSAGDEIALTWSRGDQKQSSDLALTAYPVEPAVSVKDAKPGLEWRRYVAGQVLDFPKFDQLEPEAEGIAATLGTDKFAGKKKDHYALVFEGFLKIEPGGFHRLILASDDGSRLFLHGEMLIDNGGPHPRQELGRKVRLTKGLHPIRIDYFEATESSTLELFLEDEKGERVQLGEGAFFHEGAGTGEAKESNE